jgi:hypothetical protein
LALQLEVYSREDPKRKLDILPRALKATFLEERDGDGGGSFVIHNDDDRAQVESILQDRNIIKARIDGKCRSGFIIQKKDPTFIGKSGKSDELTTISGNGFLSWFNDASLATEFGMLGPQFESRSFNFASNAVATGTTSTWYAATQWTRPWHVAKYGNDKDNPYRYKPAEWPDAPDSYWMWANREANAGVGFCYFRSEFVVTNANLGKYSLFVAADDYFEVYVDGQQVAVETDSPSTFEQTHRYDFDVDVAGTHVIGIKVQNIRGRGGLLATVFQNGDAAKKTKAKIVVPSKSPNWWMARLPVTPPNWTLGEIWDVLLREAKSRGVWFADTVTPGYTKDADSNGKPWSRDLEWTFSIGESYHSIMKKMQELAADFWIDPETYQLHIAQSRGVDRTTDSNATVVPMLFRKAYDLQGGEQKSEWSVKNSLIVESQGKRQLVQDQNSIAKYGTIEDVLNLETDAELAKIIAEKVVQNSSSPDVGATYTVALRDNSIPFVDYQVGDWVMAPGDAGPRTRRRIESISFSASDATTEITYAVEFDTVFKSRQARLEQLVTNTINGSLNGKLYNASQIKSRFTQNLGSTNNTGLKIPPVAPAIQTGTPMTAYFSPAGVARASVLLEWDPVTETEDGGEVENATYEVWGVNLTSSVNVAASPVLFAETTDLQAQVNDLEPNSSYEFTLRAVSDSGAVSEVSEPYAVETYVPVDSPPAPTPPVVTSKAASVSVYWDGNFVNNEVFPGFESVQPAISLTPGGPYNFAGTPLSSDGTTTIVDPPTGVTLYVALASRSKSGIYSNFSAETSIVVQGVGTAELSAEINESIDSAHAEAEAAAEAAANAQTTANGKNARRRGKTEAELDVPPGGWVPGDQWIVENADGAPVEVRVWNGTAFVQDQILSSDLLILGPGGVVQIKDGKITANSLAADAIDGKTIRGATIIGGLVQGATFELVAVTGSAGTITDSIPTTSNPLWDASLTSDGSVFRSSPYSLRGGTGTSAGTRLWQVRTATELGDIAAASDIFASVWVRVGYGVQARISYGSDSNAIVSDYVVNNGTPNWEKIGVLIPKGTESRTLYVQTSQGTSPLQPWFNVDDLSIGAPGYGTSRILIDRRADGLPRVRAVDGNGVDTTSLDPTGFYSNDGVSGGNVVTISAAQVQFTHGDNVLDLRVDNSGITRSGGGSPLVIQHQSNALGSDINISTGGNTPSINLSASKINASRPWDPTSTDLVGGFNTYNPTLDRAYFGGGDGSNPTSNEHTYMAFQHGSGMVDTDNAAWIQSTVGGVGRNLVRFRRSGHMDNPHLPVAMAAGGVAGASVPAGGVDRRTIGYPAGRFSISPLVTGSISNGIRDVTFSTETPRTTTSFVAIAGNTGSIARTVEYHWQAIQMSFTAAGG